MLLVSRLQRLLPFYYGWVIVGASGTAVFARMAPAITTLSIFIYPLSQEFGWSRTLISGTVTVGAITALVLSPAIGWAIDRFGSRPVLVVSTLVLGAAMASLSWATIPIAFYLVYAVGRVIFHTSAPIAASTLASRWFVRKRGRAIGAIYVCNAVGGVVFTMLAALVIRSYGIHVAWIVIGAVVLAVSVAPNLLLVVERPEDIGLAPDGDDASQPDQAATTGHGEGTVPEESWTVGEALRTTAFWTVLLVGMLHFFVHTGVSVHIAAYLQDGGLSATNAAAAVSFSWVVSGFSAMAWGWALERVQPRVLYSIIMVCAAGALLVLVLVPGALGAYLAAGMIGVLSAGGLVVPAVVYADFFGRAHLGTIRGFGETRVLVGQAAGPLFAGLMFDLRGGYGLVFAVYAALAAAGILLVLGARRPDRRPWLKEAG